MPLIRQTPAYAIAGGDHNFDAVQTNHDNVIIQVVYSGIVVSDVTLELHESVTGSNFDLVEDSAIVVDQAKTSHSWNVRGLVRGIFLRVKVAKGTATAGTINVINFLYE